MVILILTWGGIEIAQLLQNKGIPVGLRSGLVDNERLKIAQKMGMPLFENTILGTMDQSIQQITLSMEQGRQERRR